MYLQLFIYAFFLYYLDILISVLLQQPNFPAGINKGVTYLIISIKELLQERGTTYREILSEFKPPVYLIRTDLEHTFMMTKFGGGLRPIIFLTFQHRQSNTHSHFMLWFTRREKVGK